MIVVVHEKARRDLAAIRVEHVPGVPATDPPPPRDHLPSVPIVTKQLNNAFHAFPLLPTIRHPSRATRLPRSSAVRPHPLACAVLRGCARLLFRLHALRHTQAKSLARRSARAKAARLIASIVSSLCGIAICYLAIFQQSQAESVLESKIEPVRMPSSTSASVRTTGYTFSSGS